MTTPNQMDEGTNSTAAPLYDHAYDILYRKGFCREECDKPATLKAIARFRRDSNFVTLTIDIADVLSIVKYRLGDDSTEFYTNVSSVGVVDRILG